MLTGMVTGPVKALIEAEDAKDPASDCLIVLADAAINHYMTPLHK